MRSLLLVSLVCLSLAGGGCIVDGQCQADYDCRGSERCNHATGHCEIECTTTVDCFVNGGDIGKECINSRCEFSYDKRVPAPNFCLKVLNPRSSYYGQNFCLSSQRGKVVLLYFAWLT